jgi:hypothetical protein
MVLSVDVFLCRCGTSSLDYILGGYAINEKSRFFHRAGELNCQWAQNLHKSLLVVREPFCVAMSALEFALSFAALAAL